MNPFYLSFSIILVGINLKIRILIFVGADDANHDANDANRDANGANCDADPGANRGVNSYI